jgi:hypothetical protein
MRCKDLDNGTDNFRYIRSFHEPVISLRRADVKRDLYTTAQIALSSRGPTHWRDHYDVPCVIGIRFGEGPRSHGKSSILILVASTQVV